MSIKEQLTEIWKAAAQAKASDNKARLRLAAQIATFVSELEDATDIPADVLEPMDNDGRKVVLALFVQLIAREL